MRSHECVILYLCKDVEPHNYTLSDQVTRETLTARTPGSFTPIKDLSFLIDRAAGKIVQENTA